MSTKTRINTFAAVLMILTLVLSAALPSAASAQGGDGVKRQVNPQSGRVSFIGPESGRALSASKALGTFFRPQDPAMALAKRFAPEFGLMNPERDLSEIKANRSENGRLTVRYQQSYKGIPVMGGELIVNTNEKGDLYSMNGEVSPNLSLPTQPTVDSAQAAETVLQAVAKWYERSPADFIVSEPELWIYDESLLKPSTRPVELVWRMEVTPVDQGMPVRELVLVDAQRGGISLHFNQVDTAWHSLNEYANIDLDIHLDRKGKAVLGSPVVSTYTANNSTTLPGTFLCNQTQINCTSGTDTHADAAQKY
ncbi:MAG: hypothetical protein R3307_10950, partial [Anaerolineales bacterium]|nr:hypothetical protein [Anaerolineales bacterium]